MKQIRLIIPLLLSILMLFLCTSSTFAYERTEHDKIMCDVLFKSFKNIENDKDNEDEIKALEAAAYLTIDQYNGSGEEELKCLKGYGVKGLPSLKDIDYQSNQYHRKATHRGWDAESKGVYNSADNARWIIRKKILVNTSEKIFNFDGDKNKKDSFCALIYYIHILGDRMSGDKYYPNTVIMELGGRGRIDEQDVVHELEHHIEILFEDQKHTHKYRHVIRKLDFFDSKISALLKKNDGKLSDEDFKTYKEYGEKIEEVLEHNIPEMLKDEEFFNKAFY